MPKSSTPENVPNALIPPKTDEIFEYVLNHSDEFRKSLEKRYILVRENYPILKALIDGQCTSLTCTWVAEGLRCNYEDVATVLDYETLKKLVGEDWFKF